MKMFFTLTCKERGEGVCTDLLWVKSATFWWKDWKIVAVLLNHSSSVVKVGVLAPHTLEPALCKQFNKNCGYDGNDWHFGVLFCPSYSFVKTWENSSDCLSTTATLLILVILNSMFPQEYILENKSPQNTFLTTPWWVIWTPMLKQNV